MTVTVMRQRILRQRKLIRELNRIIAQLAENDRRGDALNREIERLQQALSVSREKVREAAGGAL